MERHSNEAGLDPNKVTGRSLRRRFANRSPHRSDCLENSMSILEESVVASLPPPHLILGGRSASWPILESSRNRRGFWFR